jgi:hypothetical protein
MVARVVGKKGLFLIYLHGQVFNGGEFIMQGQLCRESSIPEYALNISGMIRIVKGQ